LSQSDLLSQLMESLRCLPGVGQKSAQRMAYHLLERNREGGMRLATTLQESLKRIGHCAQCRDFTEQECCAICASAARDSSQLCVVETPADRLVIELATGYRGLYFILQGRLSPLDGVGPRELGLDKLAKRLAEGVITEMIIATNPTVEGEATAHYLAQLARQFEVKPSKLAHGVPIGGELEYVDRGTLAHAFGTRIDMP
jgi:recombination protein RecR